MPKNESERPLTPEEMRWRAAAWDPEKWLAEYPKGNEGWAEYSRTDYPALLNQ